MSSLARHPATWPERAWRDPLQENTTEHWRPQNRMIGTPSRLPAPPHHPRKFGDPSRGPEPAGLTDAQTAASLSISENTVKTHVARVYGKPGVHEHVQAVIIACDTGLVAPTPRPNVPERTAGHSGGGPREGPGAGEQGGVRGGPRRRIGVADADHRTSTAGPVAMLESCR